MKLYKPENQLPDEEVIILSMTPDEYGLMCKFMTDNGIGYGPGRTMTNKWREAREEFKKK